MTRRAISPLALFFSGVVLVFTAALGAHDENGGPLVLMGIDAEDNWRSTINGTDTGQHGPIENYVILISSVLGKVTNERTGILVIGGGKSSSDDVTTFWRHIAADVGQPIRLVSGAAAIANISFGNEAIIAVASDALNTPSGGLTEEENEALAARQSDIARFVNRGGGLVGFTSDFRFSPPYGYIDSLGEFEIASNLEPPYSDIEPLNSGPELGITNDLDVCCWHDVYVRLPSFLEVLALDVELTGLPAAVGGLTTFVPEAKTVNGYMKLGGGRIDTTGVRHWFHLGCSPASRSTLERLTVRWDNNTFHLDEMVTATCTTASSTTRNKGKGAFTTHAGSGFGRLSNAPGVYTAEWRFFDGDRRTADTATIVIRDPRGAVVVTASGELSQGDQQTFGKNR